MGLVTAVTFLWFRYYRECSVQSVLKDKNVNSYSKITTNTANTVYKSFISPVLKYCDTVWKCCGKVNARLSTLEKLQRRAARIIVKSSNNEQAMSSLAFDSLADRRDKHVLRFVKKCIEGKIPQFFF